MFFFSAGQQPLAGTQRCWDLMGAVISPLTSSGSIRSVTVKGGAAPYILTWRCAEHQSCCDCLQEQQPLQRWLWQSQAVPRSRDSADLREVWSTGANCSLSCTPLLASAAQILTHLPSQRAHGDQIHLCLAGAQSPAANSEL